MTKLRLPILPGHSNLTHLSGDDHLEHHHADSENLRSATKTKVILVLGPLGSGKTSLVKWVLSKHGKVLGKLRLIINDVGKEKVDADRLSNDLDLADEDLVALQSGCICCEDLDSLRKAVGDLRGKLDTIVIEPTGIAEGEAITEMLDKLDLPVATVTLMDVLHHRLRSEAELAVVDTQLKVADVIGLTWWEGASQEQVDQVLAYIGARKNKAGERLNLPVINLPKRAFGQTEILGDDYSPEYERIFMELGKNRSKLLVHRHNHEHEHGHHDHHHHHHEGDEHDNLHHEHVESAPVYSMTFDHLPDTFDESDLQKFFAKYGDILIRSKGVVGGRRFNYVWGSLNWEVAEGGPARLNFITSVPIDQEKVLLDLKVVGEKEHSEMSQAYFLSIEQFINNYLKMNNEQLRNYTEAEINKLIDMYHQWMKMDLEIKEMSTKGENQAAIATKQIEQKSLGEAMTFANPLIWLGYKIRAYAGSPKELKTLADLRKHAENPDYICHKRLSYLSDAMKSKTGLDLWKDWPAETDLNGLFNDQIWWEISADPEFITGWQGYEYFRQSDGDRMRVAKWENWKRN